MKYLSRIMVFMAMVTIASCTTDTTSDLGAEAGNKTTLSLSIEASIESSRTQLGEKAESLYPLTWSVGDRVSINGIFSEALTEYEAGSDAAVFTFDTQSLDKPYCIAYPATEVGKVLFPATQSYKADNISSNATVLYGYSTDGSATQLNHLTSVLKIGIKGSATLASARISTVGRTPIAGLFNMDFETGRFTATESATEIITYNFGAEGVALSEDKTKYIHVAVPAGTYGELYVVLEDIAGGVMSTTINADESKPIAAGTVREFKSDIVFVPIEGSKVFAIYDYATLLNFKRAVEGGADADAVITSDFEITAADEEKAGAPWSPINNPDYTGEINGNGYAIKGLTKPLFDSVAATIKGVHLKDVKISKAYTSQNTGALVNTYLGTSLTYCSVEGSIEAVRENNVANKVGGMIGSISNFSDNWEIRNCTNSCSVSLEIAVTTATDAEGNDLAQQATCVGGVIADSYCHSKSGMTVILANLTNNGLIHVKGSTEAVLNVGGVLSRLHNYRINMTSCHNTGDVNIELGATVGLNVAGVFSKFAMSTSAPILHNFTATDCSNSGNVSVKITESNTSSSYSSIGGCFGDLQNVHIANITLTNCKNSGNVELDTSTITADNQFHVAGIGGCLYGRVMMEGCENSGEYVKMTLGTATNRICTGGLVGRLASRSYSDDKNTADNLLSVKDCTNNADVYSTISTSHKLENHIGGAIGLTYSYSSTLSTFSFDNVDNYGSVISNTKAYSDTNARTWVGGIIGTTYISGSNSNANKCPFTINNCDNGRKGDNSKMLNVTGGMHYYTYVGGMIGYTVFPVTSNNCSNHMQYLCDAKSINKYTYYGGFTGKLTHLAGISVIKDFTNSANVTMKGVSPSSGTTLDIGLSGVIGFMNRDKNKIDLRLTNIINSGDIMVGGSDELETVKCTNLQIGGINARMDTYTDSKYSFTSVINTGDITVKNTEATTNAYIGGAIGFLAKMISNIQSYCAIDICDNLAPAVMCGSLAGGRTDTTSISINNCKVGGSLTIGGTTTTLDKNNYMSKICGYASAACSLITLLESEDDIVYPTATTE